MCKYTYLCDIFQKKKQKEWGRIFFLYNLGQKREKVMEGWEWEAKLKRGETMLSVHGFHRACLPWWPYHGSSDTEKKQKCVFDCNNNFRMRCSKREGWGRQGKGSKVIIARYMHAYSKIMTVMLIGYYPCWYYNRDASTRLCVAVTVSTLWVWKGEGNNNMERSYIR